MSRQLSKGTLGLKFMNRVQPTTPNSPSSPAAAAQQPNNSTAAQSANTPSKTAPSGTSAFRLKQEEDIVKDEPSSQSFDAAPVASTSKHIIQESSLLSFPLLSAGGASYSHASSSSIANYSSMPHSSFTVSGRRSFGGANVDIELLNNPQLAQQQQQAKGGAGEGEAESNSQRKKRERAEKAATITGRGAGSTPRSRPIKEEDEGEQGSAGKKVKLNGGYVKPEGFEGAKKASGGKQTKRQPPIESEDDIELDSENHFDQSEESDSSQGEDEEEVEKFLASAVKPKAATKAVNAAERKFADGDDSAAGEGGLNRNQKRKLAKKKAAEQAEARLASSKKK